MANERLLPSVLTAAGIVFAGFLVGDAIRYTKKFESAVEVRGLDERLVRSDRASWQLNLAVTAATLPAANDALVESGKALREFLASQGFDERELRAGPTYVSDAWANGMPNARPESRYTVRGGVVLETAKVDAVEKVSQSTGDLLKRGIRVDNSNVRYYFTDLNKVKTEMLAAATANARQAAEAFAKDSKTRLGGIKSASQGLFTIGAPLAEYEGETSVMKKVRVVTRVQYFLEK
ncbi:MAG TPA: SIMPL domain-containing protein [Thermoanaerobaculia bacterium]|nr:SIMPL domain-containing protein [Thermoanaerobaculia bacterium]